MPTIVIDPGHGGSDPGAVNGTRYEKNDNLRMGLAVASRLRNKCYNVVMTRNTDVYVTLTERANISNRANADLFVSLHRNSAANPIYNGLEVYVYTNPSATSLLAAKNVSNRIAAAGVQTNHGVKYGNFSVLRQTNAPAILVELNFISNAYDNILFDQNFDAYADAIVQGIADTIPPPANCGGGTGGGGGGGGGGTGGGGGGGGTGGGGGGTGGGTATDRVAKIKTIQQTLNSRYGTGLTVDGIFGAKTKTALIKGLQYELNKNYGAGLTVDGVFGAKTKAAIRSQRYGDKNNIVWLLQAMLFIKGYDITVDGIFGAGTQNAVSSFQRAQGLTADGIAGPNTFEALIKSL